jgi:hypothetical protein
VNHQTGRAFFGPSRQHTKRCPRHSTILKTAHSAKLNRSRQTPSKSSNGQHRFLSKIQGLIWWGSGCSTHPFQNTGFDPVGLWLVGVLVESVVGVLVKSVVGALVKAAAQILSKLRDFICRALASGSFCQECSLKVKTR